MIGNEPSTPVTIYGKTYHLRGDGDSKYLHELAGEVDRQMRDVAASTGTADTLSLAILAALNITDECLQAQRSPEPTGAERQLDRWAALIDDTLADPDCQPLRSGSGRADGSA